MLLMTLAVQTAILNQVADSRSPSLGSDVELTVIGWFVLPLSERHSLGHSDEYQPWQLAEAQEPGQAASHEPWEVAESSDL